MGIIYVVRHGQDEDNANGILNGRRDMPLTELGRQQARDKAEDLVGKNIDIIISTPLERGYETATIMRRRLGLSADRQRIHPKLIERDFGILTGRKVCDIPTICSNNNLLRTERITYFLEAKGAENFPTLLKRAETVLNDVEQKHRDENILLVCHGDIGCMIRAVFYSWSWEKGLTYAHFDNCGIFQLPDPAIAT